MLNRRGQNIVEYSTLIIIAISVSIAMYPYAIRAWNAGMKGYEDSYEDAHKDPLKDVGANRRFVECNCHWEIPAYCRAHPEEKCCGLGCASNEKPLVYVCDPIGCDDNPRDEVRDGSWQCDIDPGCCGAWTPQDYPDDCGARATDCGGCKEGEICQERECGETKQYRCEKEINCSMRCYGDYPEGVQYDNLCPGDDEGLERSSPRSYVLPGECTDDRKCEGQCAPGFVPAIDGFTCECPKGTRLEGDKCIVPCSPSEKLLIYAQDINNEKISTGERAIIWGRGGNELYQQSQASSLDHVEWNRSTLIPVFKGETLQYESSSSGSKHASHELSINILNNSKSVIQSITFNDSSSSTFTISSDGFIEFPEDGYAHEFNLLHLITKDYTDLHVVDIDLPDCYAPTNDSCSTSFYLEEYIPGVEDFGDIQSIRVNFPAFAYPDSTPHESENPNMCEQNNKSKKNTDYTFVLTPERNSLWRTLTGSKETITETKPAKFSDKSGTGGAVFDFETSELTLAGHTGGGWGGCGANTCGGCLDSARVELNFCESPCEETEEDILIYAQDVDGLTEKNRAVIWDREGNELINRRQYADKWVVNWGEFGLNIDVYAGETLRYVNLGTNTSFIFFNLNFNDPEVSDLFYHEIQDDSGKVGNEQFLKIPADGTLQFPSKDYPAFEHNALYIQKEKDILIYAQGIEELSGSDNVKIWDRDGNVTLDYNGCDSSMCLTVDEEETRFYFGAFDFLNVKVYPGEKIRYVNRNRDDRYDFLRIHLYKPGELHKVPHSRHDFTETKPGDELFVDIDKELILRFDWTNIVNGDVALYIQPNDTCE